MHNRIRKTGNVLISVFTILLTVNGTGLAAPVPQQSIPPNSETVPTRLLGATVNITYLENTQVGDNTCGAWPSAAERTAIEYAATIWEADDLLITNIPIEIHACWCTNLPGGIISRGEAAALRKNFPGVKINNTYYPIALANALADEDLDLSLPDLYIFFNNSINWYTGTDAAPSSTQYDLVAAAMRSIGQGLGIGGFMRVTDGKGYWVSFQDGNPALYDRFIENGSGQTLIDSYADGSTSLATQLQSGEIYFSGYSANIANGGAPSQLYAPNPWETGVSYIHLAPTYHDSENGLLAHPAPGKAYHDLGPIALGILRDLGWDIIRNTNPLLIDLPDQELPMNSSQYKVTDLWEYASDAETADDARLEFSIDTPTPHVSLSEDEENPNMRYLNLHPAFGWTGEMAITIRVTDPGDLWDTDTFTLSVTNTPPTLADIPDILAPTNLYTQVLDLRRYTTDKEDVKSSLVFSIIADSNPVAGVAISGSRFIEISPTVGFLGTTDVTVQVQDTGQATATDAFSVTITDQNITPTVHISDKRVIVNRSRQIDLWDLDWDGENDYARDPEGLPITTTISNSPDINAGVSITQNRYIMIEPAYGWIGQTDVEIQATDPGGLSGVDSFRVTVWTPVSIYLPLVMKNYGVIEEGRQYLYPFK